MTFSPVYDDGQVSLFVGDVREVLYELDLSEVSVVLADPPYGQTALEWDRWPQRWPGIVADAVPEAASMWCCGTLRMVMDRWQEFVSWRLAQDMVAEWEIDTAVWEKPRGTGPGDGRFMRVHELVAQWYRGPWAEVYNATPRDRVFSVDQSVNRKGAPTHRGADTRRTAYVDDGTRVARTVLRAPSMRHQRRNATEKPLAVIAPLVEASCPPGGLVLDLFSGSGSGLRAAKDSGRRGIGVELRPEQAAIAVERLRQEALA